MGSAPYGYKHGRTDTNKPCIVPDDKETGFVQMAFEMLAVLNCWSTLLEKDLELVS